MRALLGPVIATVVSTVVELAVNVAWKCGGAKLAMLLRRWRRRRAGVAVGMPSWSLGQPDSGPGTIARGDSRSREESSRDGDVHPDRQNRPYEFGDQFPNSLHSGASVPVAAQAGFWPDSVRKALVECPPRVFRGREDLLALLTGALSERGGIHVLHAMPGAGKTVLAAEVFRAAEQAEMITLWVSASDGASFRRMMIAAAAGLGADPAEVQAADEGRLAAADLVWRYLDDSPRPWILVIDKADEPELLERGHWLRSSPAGTVVVTTRRARDSQWENAEMHHLDVLPLDDAAQLLMDFASDRGTFQDARDLAGRLGCLPLALRLAGGYLENQALETWSLNEYRRRFDEEGARLADQGAAVPVVERANVPITERELRQLLSWTWRITLNSLTAQGLPETSSLIRLLSCWSPAPLPRAVLTRGTAAADMESPMAALFLGKTEAALRALLDNSLVAAHDVPSAPDGATTPCVQTHGLVLESVHAVIPAQDRPAFLHTAAQLIDAALPEHPTPADAGQLRLLTPHVTALLHHADADSCSAVVQLAIRMAQQICELGDYQTAVDLATLAGNVSERFQGLGHRDGMAARHHQGDYLRRRGSYREAEILLRRVHNQRADKLGARNEDTLATAAALSMTLYLLGDVEESLNWIQRTIDGQRRTRGKNDVETLRSCAFALEFLAHSGSEERFLRDGPSTISACERSLGVDHAVTAIAYSNYAYGLLSVGTPQEAKTAAERALRARIRAHGDDHPLVYSAKLVLSWAHGLCGDHETALALMSEAVEGRERLLGATHPLSIKARVLHAERLAAAGFPDRAMRLLQENLEDAEDIYGAHDPDVLRAVELRCQLTAAGDRATQGGTDRLRELP